MSSSKRQNGDGVLAQSPLRFVLEASSIFRSTVQLHNYEHIRSYYIPGACLVVRYLVPGMICRTKYVVYMIAVWLSPPNFGQVDNFANFEEPSCTSR